MNHLDATRWVALQSRRDEALLAHLEAGCDTCDEFLASLPGPEGEVDALLLSLAPRAPSADELAWARLRRRLRTKPVTRWLVLAAAMGVLLLGARWLGAPEHDAQGVKGSGEVHLELRAALRAADGSFTALDDGASVPASAALVFQVRSGLAGPARLFVRRGGGEPQELAQVGLVEGAQELELAGEGLLGFSLVGERGPLEVWLVAAEAPTSLDDALTAVRLGGGEGLGVAHLRVDVAP